MIREYWLVIKISASDYIFLFISKILLKFTLTSMVYCCQSGGGEDYEDDSRGG